MERRIFLKNSAAASLSFALSPALLEFGSFAQKLSFGIISDLHQDIMHDGPERLDQFLSQVKKKSPDAIIQLGDFSYPSTSNLPLIEAFNAAHPERHRLWAYQSTMPGSMGNARSVLQQNDKGSPADRVGWQ